MRQRDTREAKALAYLRSRRVASALELGSAAVRGEPWAASRRAWKAKEQIGLALAVTLTRDGMAKPTKGNMFEIA